jgi:hypothetical protein
VTAACNGDKELKEWIDQVEIDESKLTWKDAGVLRDIIF